MKETVREGEGDRKREKKRELERKGEEIQESVPGHVIR